MTELCITYKRVRGAAKTPTYGRTGDAGLDLCAVETGWLKPHERMLVPTGIAMEIPEGYVGLLWDKSGLSTNRGVTTLAGVVDSNYRGEIFVTLLNTSEQTFFWNLGDKIAQILIQPVQTAVLLEVAELSDTNRQDAALGSSGA